MTTIDPASLTALPHQTQKRPGFLARLVAAIRQSRLRRARARMLIQLSHYDTHMLRDMGIDPADVTDALNRRSMSLLFYPIRPLDER